jgi:hypothetical protein
LAASTNIKNDSEIENGRAYLHGEGKTCLKQTEEIAEKLFYPPCACSITPLKCLKEHKLYHCKLAPIIFPVGV